MLNHNLLTSKELGQPVAKGLEPLVVVAEVLWAVVQLCPTPHEFQS
jgi:hypothetical protein